MAFLAIFKSLSAVNRLFLVPFCVFWAPGGLI
jgi:hypothetical protein